MPPRLAAAAIAAAAGATESFRPARGEQVLAAGLLGGEALLELQDRPRVRGPRHPPKLRHRSDGANRIRITELVSIGPLGDSADIGAELLSISGDGQTIAFATREQLTDEDTDNKMDFYLRRVGQLAKARHGKTIGSAAFRIAPGKRKRIQVSLRSSLPMSAPAALFARVRGIDRLGNSSTALRRVALAVR
jgi:hypothetical protein